MKNAVWNRAGHALPGPRTCSPLGSFLEYRRDPLAFYMGLALHYGDAGTFRIFGLRHVFINSPALIESLLVDRAQDFTKFKILQPLAGDGLVNSEGAFHHHQRKLMAPAFRPRHLSSYDTTMVAAADRRQARWTDGETVDMAAEMMRLSMDVITTVLLGADAGGGTAVLGKAVMMAVHHWGEPLSKGMPPMPLAVPTPANLRTRRLVAFIKGRLQSVIAEQETRGSGGSGNDPAGGNLLAMIMQERDEDEGGAMCPRQLLDEVLTLILAGHDTIAMALTWTFYLLAQHPDSLARLHAEVDEVLGGRLPGHTDLSRLPFTVQVFKEALRLYPPSAAMVRRAQHDTMLDDRLPIRKGEAVVLSQYVLHRRLDTFPDPERFDPDRFAPTREQALPRGAYLPFGAGPRICIGNHFSLMEGPLMLATIAQKVRLELPRPHVPSRPQLAVTLRPNHPIRLRVVRRTAT